MVLFVDACVRKRSRTKRLADYYLSKLDGGIACVFLPAADFPAVTEEYLDLRDTCAEGGDFPSPVFRPAKDFAAAEEIVIAAPFWDLSFPSALKRYLEQITVRGITFTYTEDGMPRGLCQAKKLVYITTSGGPIFSADYGYGYVRALATQFYGIPRVVLVKAEGLDMDGADAEEILRCAERSIDRLFSDPGPGP